ncbi:hypothetical protein ACHAPO_010327 [Fusarium lateritium]
MDPSQQANNSPAGSSNSNPAQIVLDLHPIDLRRLQNQPRPQQAGNNSAGPSNSNPPQIVLDLHQPGYIPLPNEPTPQQSDNNPAGSSNSNPPQIALKLHPIDLRRLQNEPRPQQAGNNSAGPSNSNPAQNYIMPHLSGHRPLPSEPTPQQADNNPAGSSNSDIPQIVLKLHQLDRRRLPNEPTPQQAGNNHEARTDHSQGYTQTHNPTSPRRHHRLCAEGLYRQLERDENYQIPHQRRMEIAEEMHKDVKFVTMWLSLHLQSYPRVDLDKAIATYNQPTYCPCPDSRPIGDLGKLIAGEEKLRSLRETVQELLYMLDRTVRFDEYNA